MSRMTTRRMMDWARTLASPGSAARSMFAKVPSYPTPAGPPRTHRSVRH